MSKMQKCTHKERTEKTCIFVMCWCSLTFIMSTIVLRAIIIMMEYSNGGETTNLHMRYWKDWVFSGMYRVRGLALMAKSMQALCKKRKHTCDLKWKLALVASRIFGPSISITWNYCANSQTDLRLASCSHELLIRTRDGHEYSNIQSAIWIWKIKTPFKIHWLI